jgi:hypothetical protein
MQRISMKKNVALALAGLVVGCGAGAVTTHHVSAQGFTSPTPQGPSPVAVRWQQHCEQAPNVQEASNLAGVRGVEGYELVALYNGVMCFKRPVPSGAGAQGPAAAPYAPAPLYPPGAGTTWPGY